MQERHTNREAYFNEQAHTTRKFYIPYIQKNIKPISQEILEVGCGEGGNLLPFAEAGYHVTGVDISKVRIDQAKTFFAERNKEGIFIDSDIFKLHELEHKFSLILVHDVIEHIGNKEQFISDLQKFLAPDGYIFLAFPAWQMPFGGHQQIARTRIVSHLPFLHLLPSFLYKKVLKMCGEQDDMVTELLSIKQTKCTIEHFLKITKKVDFKIIDQQLYFINPHYETKFGLTPRKLNRIIAKCPYVRNFFCTTCFYILQPNVKETTTHTHCTVEA